MFRRVLLAVLCLVPSVALAQETIDIGPGLYWRWVIEWKDDTESGISFRVEGFRDSGKFGSWSKLYPYWELEAEGIPGELPPPLRLFASSDNRPDLLDINGDQTLDDRDRASFDVDGDYDLDISDLNAVRNDFGSRTQSDIDGNGTVDIADLNTVRNGFLRLSPFSIGTPPWEPYHVDWDDAMWLTGEVEDDCVLLLDARNFANPVVPCSEAMSTPEPSAFALAGIAIMALSRRIWSKCRQS